MNARTRYGFGVLTAALLSLLASACNDDSEYFYTATYPIIKVDAEVSVKIEQPENPDGSDDSTASDDTTASAEELLTEQIRAEVVAEAPVQAGGYYQLEFKYADSGRLCVKPEEGAEVIAGGFIKQPGSSQIEFHYGEQIYTGVLSIYAGDDFLRYKSIEVDLTEEFQARYPNATVSEVIRVEYTPLRD